MNDSFDKNLAHEIPDPDSAGAADPLTDDHVGFEYPTDRLATRPARKPLEKGMGRPLGLAVILGVSMGSILFYLKPAPRSAEARPAILPASRTAPALPAAPEKKRVELFVLPPWNDAAETPN